jgi:hypothetical protein
MRSKPLVFIACAFALSADVSAQETVGAFTLAVERDATGANRHSISTTALPASVTAAHGASLTWVCVNDALRVFYTSGVPLRGDDVGGVEVTYETDPAAGQVDDDWWVSSDGQRVVAPAESTEDFTRRAREAGVMVVGVRDPGTALRRSHRFSMRGFGDAIARLPCAGA